MKTTKTTIQREERANAAASRAGRRRGLEVEGPDHAAHQARQQTMQGSRKAVTQGKGLVGGGAAVTAPLQREENKTGLPDEAKTGMEAAFGADFSDVRVHSSSPKAPAVGALAYTQGNEVHFAPGQFSPDTSTGRQLLGHELAHVVQQREGRVAPTTQVAGMPVNDNHGLEAEADAAGRQAASLASSATGTAQRASREGDAGVAQKVSMPEEEELKQGKFAAQLKVKDEEELMKP